MTVHLPIDVDVHHPAFEGHFPSRPIVPGVVLLDRSLRAIERHRGETGACFSGRIGAAKFLSIVGPGEPLRLEVVPSATRGYQLKVYAGVDDGERLALTGNVTFEPADDAQVASL